MYSQLNTPNTKKPANLSSNSDLRKKARARQWLKENRMAIDEYNKRIEREGLFSDEK